MADADLALLVGVLEEQTRWPKTPGAKAKRYVGRFFDAKRTGAAISARVDGNHGTYTVSIRADDGLSAACSCYIGKQGYCHHCHALALTFLADPAAFTLIETKALEEVESLADLKAYLDTHTLEDLLKEMRERGITQKAFAEAVGMNPRHLTAVRGSELRNRTYNELGAVKLAVLWTIEHLGMDKP